MVEPCTDSVVSAVAAILFSDDRTNTATFRTSEAYNHAKNLLRRGVAMAQSLGLAPGVAPVAN